MSLTLTSYAVPEIAAIPFGYRLHQALQDMRMGRPVILVDNFDRENEADLIVAAEKISTNSMATMIRECSGIVCLCITDELADRLSLPLMVPDNSSPFRTAFTVTIEARRGVTTGVSAQDRVTTIRTAVADFAAPEDLVRPGHVFPLRAAAAGLAVRQGHTEGSVELARLAGLKPAAVLSELTNPDGTMCKDQEIERFARKHGMTVLTIEELVENQRGWIT